MKSLFHLIAPKYLICAILICYSYSDVTQVPSHRNTSDSGISCPDAKVLHMINYTHLLHRLESNDRKCAFL